VPKFRKKPVVIEAWQVGSDVPKPSWLKFAQPDGMGWQFGNADDYAIIVTLEGQMRAERRDWIIQGVKGELYPCKPDIFEQTHEPVLA
jgi:hypothetical protein